MNKEKIKELIAQILTLDIKNQTNAISHNTTDYTPIQLID